jgi:predicted transposase YbfD/YdcC
MTTAPTTAPLSLRCFFGRLSDPRRNHLKRHLLLDIIGITLCAVLAGANDWQQIVTFATHRRAWLETFLALPNGIPSHDTLERVFDHLDLYAFQACFQRWVEALAGTLGLGHIAIDGKALRGSGNATKGWKALHLVSAWATQCHLSLGQVAVDTKSNEITAIPLLLELLDLHGALVTIDAMGCQKAIARQIVDGGGDYLLNVKDNQPHLLEDIQNTIADVLDKGSADNQYQQWEIEEKGHGRREKRTYLIITDLEGIRHREEWKGLKVIGMCLSEREHNGKRSDEVRYFIGSREMNAQAYGQTLRAHWGIENNLHWQLDIVFREDGNRVQRRNGATNLALLRRLAVSLLKQHPSKLSLPCKRLAAALTPAFLEEILASGCKL